LLGYWGLALLLACAVIGLGGASVLVALIAVGEHFGLPPAMLKLEGAVSAISMTVNASNLGVLAVILLPWR
jgi:hypothetical protein